MFRYRQPAPCAENFSFGRKFYINQQQFTANAISCLFSIEDLPMVLYSLGKGMYQPKKKNSFLRSNLLITKKIIKFT